MRFQRHIGVLLLSVCCIASAFAGTNSPPRFRLERIAEWEQYRQPGTLLLNNRGQLAAMMGGEDGVHFFIRGHNRYVEIPLPMGLQDNQSALLDFHHPQFAVFWNWSSYAAYIFRAGRFMDATEVIPYNYFLNLACNQRGQIVGTGIITEFAPTTAFLYHRGYYRELGTLLPDTSSSANAINNRGMVVGSSQVTTNGNEYYLNDHRAVLFHKGQVKDLGVLPGHHTSTATGINDRGTVIGWSAIISPEHVLVTGIAFLYRDGVMKAVRPLPGHVHTSIFAINEHDWAAGYSYHDFRERTAILHFKGVTYDLNELLPPDTEVRLISAESINNAGVIAAINQAGDVYLLKPERKLR